MGCFIGGQKWNEEKVCDAFCSLHFVLQIDLKKTLGEAVVRNSSSPLKLQCHVSKESEATFSVLALGIKLCR